MQVCYVVEERNRLDKLRSRLFTPDPWHAMAEWMVKAIRPVGFPPGAQVGDGELTLDVIGESQIVDRLVLSLDAVFRSHGQIVRTLTVRTEVLSMEIEAYYSANSAKFYLMPEYDNAVKAMVARMTRFCAGQKDVGYILTQFSSQDRLHPFWRPRMYNRGRSLGR